MSIPGFKILNGGPTGVGKTHALGTLVADWNGSKWIPHKEPKVTLFILFTEQSQEVLAGIPPSHLHWVYCPASATSAQSLLIKTSNLVDSDWDFIIKGADGNKRDCTAIKKFGGALVDFVCDRDGESYGSPSNWGTDKVLAVDGLTGLNRMARQTIIGQYVYLSQPQWGAAQQVEHSWILLLQNLPCHVILNCHVERITNELTGEVLIQPNLLGKKLGPEIGGDCTDVIFSFRRDKDFLWATERSGVDTKARIFPWTDGMFQNYQPILSRWEEMGGKEPPIAQGSMG